MSLVTFTTAYTGGPTFYTGNPGNSDLVPDIFPVAIAGRAYALDMASGRYARTFEARLRESTDDSNIPGEAAINPQGLWRRSQTDWKRGAGQEYGDTVDGLDNRFLSSKNINVWEDGKLSLLPATEELLNSANTNLHLLAVGDQLYVADGGQLKKYDSLSGSPTNIGSSGATIVALATDGYNVYIARQGAGLQRAVVGSTAAPTTYISGTETYSVLEYVKGRLMAAHDNEVHNFTQSPTTSHAHTSGILHQFTNDDIEITSFAEGLNHIYIGGHKNGVSLIYRTQIKDDATSLDVPVQAGALPVGEEIISMFGYLGYVMLGTSEGVRVCTTDTNGDLLIGPTLRTNVNVQDFAAYDRFVYFTWTNYDGTSGGLGRIDLSLLNGANEPAYATDLMVDSTSTITSVAVYGSTPVLSVSGDGVYKASSNLAESGTIYVGTWRWGIPDPKFVAFFDVLTDPLDGEVLVEYRYDNGDWGSLGSVVRQNTTRAALTGPDAPFREAAFRLTLTRDATTASEGPVVTRWQARAVPVPTRSELFQIPVLLHSRLYWKQREYFFDVDNELEFLRDLIHNPRIVTFQEGPRTYKVIAESVEWVPVDSPNDSYVFDGTATVTLRSLVE